MNKSFLFLTLILNVFQIQAQFIKESKIGGSIISNSHFYLNDNINLFTNPEQPFATNNYLKLNYSWRSFEAGIQYENYLPPLTGYSTSLKGHRIAQRYLSYNREKIKITAGHFFEQYGNGLILRTYEDKELGINTSLDGVKIRWNPNTYIQISTFGARQLGWRNHGKTAIAGSSVSLDLARLLSPEKNYILQTAFSMVYKNDKPAESKNQQNEVTVFSGEVYFGSGTFSFQTEFVSKSVDPSFINGVNNQKGFALFINPALSKKGIGLNALVRRLRSMDFRSEQTSETVFMLNYLPANTRQHKYRLANLNPYSGQPANEFSQQIDFFLVIPKNTTFGGQYGTKLALNYSLQFAEPPSILNYKRLNELLSPEFKTYSDFNIEIEKKWSPAAKTIFSYINLNMENYFLVPDYDPQKMQIGVADILYKLNQKNSISVEMQHLWAEISSKNWYSWSMEFAFMKHWLIWISDMTNYSSKGIHYPNGGIQLNYKATNISLNYGRNREGFKCSGGICRWTPAYNGFGFSLSTSF